MIFDCNRNRYIHVIKIEVIGTFNQFIDHFKKNNHFELFFHAISVSRLMGTSASGSMSHMGNMGSLATCAVNDAKSLQFPLTQRRKRRVLFTQAQVSIRKCVCIIYY